MSLSLIVIFSPKSTDSAVEILSYVVVAHSVWCDV